MALPDPLPDNPTRWDGWRNFNSDDLYARLCLSFDDSPTSEQIEQNCRLLMVWWQKKLPLKNQPSNPIAQMLRTGLDEAPQFLAEAKTKLLDPEIRGAHDAELRTKIVKGALEEFNKLLPFAISSGCLSRESEDRLIAAGARLGLLRTEIDKAITTELEQIGARRGEASSPATHAAAPAATHAPPSAASRAEAVAARDPFEEFRRVLKLSRLCVDGEEMTDDQRDALCNMGEGLGLTGGQAEDLIDEYLEEVSDMPIQAPVPAAPRSTPQRPAMPAPVRPAAVTPVVRPTVASPVPSQQPVPKPASAVPGINTSPVARSMERARYPNFKNSAGCEMLLVPSGEFTMGSQTAEAAAHEQPVVHTVIGCFYVSRFPVTNAQYELFDPGHRTRRAPWADEQHPVVYVNSKDATAFCQWLSTKEGKKYRLPTEAEWEYAARGTDNRIYPWGDRFDGGQCANFADRRTAFAWRDPSIDDGWAETSPVGSYPRGVSPFGAEDMAGNVFEWCLDFFEAYRSRSRVNPRGPMSGMKRVYRGGSWKSRANSLRASARAFNSPDYASNDVGFRIVCECI